MRLFVIAFAAGIWALQQQARLPDLTLFAGIGSVAAFLALLLRRREKSALALRRAAESVAVTIAAACAGIIWAAALAQLRLADELPVANEGHDIELTGVVASLPQSLERGVRFALDVETASMPVPSHISLAWYRGNDEDASPLIPVRAGERWRFVVRLKRPHGNINPHGMDFEAWLFERNLRATGYVRPRSAQRLDEMVWQPGYAIERLRERVRERFLRILGDAPYAGILIALAIGDQPSIDADLWRIFSRTGITHLMSISGLHVTMFAGLAYWLIAAGWRRSSRLPLWIPVQQAAAGGGFIGALAYCLLAGFAIPAQRTLYMLAVVALLQLLRRELAVSRLLALALLVVLLLDPWAVLAAGFWLSFGAVAVLLYIGSGRRATGHWLVEWLRAQWAITLGMLPALLVLFQQFSLVSPLANAVAIPLVTFVVTPLTLAGAIPGFDPLLVLAHAVTALMMNGIEWLAGLPLAVWQQAAPPAWTVVPALLGGGWLLLPRGFPSRWLGALGFLPLLTFVPMRPLAGDTLLTVLDVGQGLAVHVQTASHDLLFDAGPAFSSEADSGNRTIVPYLIASGVRKLDQLVVSHADRDHSGGAESVLAMLPVASLKTSLPFAHPLSAQPVPQTGCIDGDAWEWDGVRFEMLHPPPDLESVQSNPHSCVLRLTAAGKHVLLPSDIEATQESTLALRHPGDLAAEVLLVPHHGSRTSSTPGFITAVGARDVIFPVGYRNRFGHPKDEVVERYQQSGARLHRTDRDGALTVNLTRAGISIRREREVQRRYWHGT